jgi:hypothetical protein
MLVFREPESNRLRYGGLASWWRPNESDRNDMRSAVRRVGNVLRDRVGYRGALGIDGILTQSGFRPTELNPRISPGLAIQGMHPEGSFALGTLNRALIAGEQLDYRPAELERAVLANAEAMPQMRLMVVIPKQVETTTTVPVAISGDAVVVSDVDSAQGSLSFGPSAQGGLVMFRISPEHAIRGPSAAPIAISAAALADDLWDAGIGELIPATPVR